MSLSAERLANARVVHFIHSLEVGGLERVVLDLVRRARNEGADHSILYFDRLDPESATGQRAVEL